MGFNQVTVAIFGKGGAQIKDVREKSKVSKLDVPDRNSGLRSRDEVPLTIVGTPRAIETARKLIQKILDDWVKEGRRRRE